MTSDSFSKVFGFVKRRILLALSCLLIGLVALSFSETSIAQPPMRPGAGRGDRPGRPGDSRREGRDNREGRERPGRPDDRGNDAPPPQGNDDQGFGAPENGDPNFPEQGEGEEGQWNGPGQWGEGDPWGGRGRDRGGDQDGGEGEAQRPQEPKVPLEDALKSASGVKPVELNQDDFTAPDGVKLTGTYYKGKGDKDTPVVVLIGDLKGSADAFKPLAETLAKQGYGVLIPNLRGTGGSGELRRGPGNNNPPNDRPQMRDRASNRDIMAMINVDRRVWFNFLAYLNNLEYCNIKKTILVGSGFGAALAASWAKSDWASKDGVSQNVVGVVMFSPDASDDEGKYNALSPLESLKKRAKFPMVGYLIFVGKMNEDKLKDATEIQKKIGGKVDDSVAMEDRPCPIVAIQTELQGSELLGFESFGVPKTLVQFVALRMQKLPKKRDKWEEVGEKKSRRD